MAAFPTSIVSFGFTAAAGKGLPYDVVQKSMDEIVAIETALGAGFGSGTFFPLIVSSGGGTPTYSVQTGFWKRNPGLGIVWIYGHVTLANLGTLATGSITLAGLPVPSVNTAGLFAGVSIPWWANLTTPAINLTGFIAPNVSVVTLQLITGAVTTPPPLSKADLSATSEFIFSGIYASA